MRVSKTVINKMPYSQLRHETDACKTETWTDERQMGDKDETDMPCEPSTIQTPGGAPTYGRVAPGWHTSIPRNGGTLPLVGNRAHTSSQADETTTWA